MTPADESGFAARCAELCPGFRASGGVRRMRKSELLPGTIGGEPVIAKRLLKPDPVWSWYFAHEVRVFRAFAANPPPVRVPKLYAAEDLLVIERFDAPLAKSRRPWAELATATIERLIAIHDGLAGYPIEVGASPVRGELRRRCLEDPAEPEWIREGLVRSRDRGLIDQATCDAATAALAGAPIATNHGDLLLRNAVATGDTLTLVDWECFGRYLADWDLALLWTQLAGDGRAIVEARIRGSRPAFLALVVFALCRELVFYEAFRVTGEHPGRARVRQELDEQATALVNA